MLIDSHCHLTYPGLVEEQPAVLARARAAGVGGMLAIATRQSEWADITALAAREPDVWASLGIHPHEADGHMAVTVDTLVNAAAHPQVVALGESGLDYHYDKSDRARQRDNFVRHVEAARATGLPLVVHTREAEADTLAILGDGARAGGLHGVIHCFTSSMAFARAALDLGMFISFSGIVTFRNAVAIHEVAAIVPAARLLVETDAPFLAPVPVRGRPCEPAFVAHTAAFVAGLRGVSVEELTATTTANFFELFGKAVHP